MGIVGTIVGFGVHDTRYLYTISYILYILTVDNKIFCEVKLYFIFQSYKSQYAFSYFTLSDVAWEVCLGRGECHLKVVPGGVLEGHGKQVRPALSKGHGEDG